MSIELKAFSGGSGGASVPDASETVKGIIEIATSAEATTGTDDLKAMTPLTVKERIDAAIAGGLEYKGTFNASDGSTSPAGGIANAEQGDLYIISTAGTIYGQTWGVGDHLLVNADMGGSVTNSKIDKIDNTEPGALLAANNLSDLANAGTARTNLGVAIGSDVQAFDAQLTDVSGLTPSDGTFIVGDGSSFIGESGATARASLGLTTGTSAGNVVVLDGSARLPAVDGSQLTNLPAGGGALLAANNLSDLANAGTARTNLGVAIGSDVQAFDAGLQSISALTTAANKMIYTTGSDAYAVADLTAAGRALLDDADASAQRATLGLTDVLSNVVEDTSPQLGGDLDVNGQDITSVSNGDIEIAPHGTGVTIIKGNTGGSGTLQLNCENNSHGIKLKGPPHSAAASYTLTLPDTDGNANEVLKTDGSGNLSWTTAGAGDLLAANNLSDLANAGTARTNLGVAIGSDVQAFDAQLTDVAGLTPSDGTFIVGDGSNFIGESGATARASLGLTTGTSAGNVVVLDGSARLPAVDGSQLTNLPSAGAPTVTSASPSSAYTISTHAGNEEFYLLTPSADIAVNIPAASTSGSGFRYNIKNLSSSNSLTLTPASGTIDGDSTRVIDTQYEALTLLSDGTNYHIV